MRLGVPYMSSGEMRMRFYDVDETIIKELEDKGFEIERNLEPEYASVDWDYSFFNSDNNEVYKKGFEQQTILAKLGLQ